jgi:hypothetical protein
MDGGDVMTIAFFSTLTDDELEAEALCRDRLGNHAGVDHHEHAAEIRNYIKARRKYGRRLKGWHGVTGLLVLRQTSHPTISGVPTTNKQGRLTT